MDATASDPDIPKVIAWVERNIGGRVVHIERQPRWRPVHFIDVERDGELLRLCARQARADMPMVFPVRHEMEFQRLAGEGGVSVPRVHGWCDDPECFVMERVPGVADLEGLDEAQRRGVMYAYMEELARLHTLDVEPFKQAGIHHGASPAEAATTGQRRFDDLYRRDKVRPDPFLEFGLAWLRRNPARPARRESAIVWDSGQFHREGDAFVSLVDLELGHIGDPMIDLACLRMRDSIIGYGNFGELFEHYSHHSGIEVDIDAVRRHHLFFGLTNAMTSNSARAAPPVVSDYMVNTQWMNETNRYALEEIAALSGIDLPDSELPTAQANPASVAARHLTDLVASIEPVDPVMRNNLRRAFRLSRHLGRWTEVGPQILAEDLNDIADVTGRRPADWNDAEAALEAYVLVDDGRHDEQLILLFNRRLQRAQTLNGPVGSAMNHHHRLQAFPA